MEVIHQHFSYIKRSKGHSAVASAAYCAGERLHNNYDGKIHDYTKRHDIVYTQILLPDNAPRIYSNREVLWCEVEMGEKSSNAQLAKKFDVALPAELDQDEQIKLICDYVQKFFVDKGMCADIAIHNKDDGNPHAHVMLTLRPVDENGKWMKKLIKNYIRDEHGNKIYDPIKKQYLCGRSIPVNDWNDKSNAEKWRHGWADACNQAFERKGLDKRVTHISYARQGIKQEPTKHLGRTIKVLEKQGINVDRSNENRAIINRNQERERNERQRQLEREQKREFERSR